jgi:hypothetical protein
MVQVHVYDEGGKESCLKERQRRAKPVILQFFTMMDAGKGFPRNRATGFVCELAYKQNKTHAACQRKQRASVYRGEK